jgi:PAS domain S-box-containing protein
MAQKIRILHIDENSEDRELVRKLVYNKEFDFIGIISVKELEKCLQEKNFDFVITDFEVFGYHELEILVYFNTNHPDIPVIILTGKGSEEVAVEAMKKGASDYLKKSENNFKRLPGIILETLSAKHDSLAREEASNELRKLEELSKRLIDSSDDCIKVLDLEGNLLSMNIGGQKHLEIDDIQPYLNKSWADFWKGNEREIIQETIIKARNGETAYLSGFCPTVKNNPKWWDIIISPIRNANGEVEQLLAISRDITKSKQTELKLFESEEIFRNFMEHSPIYVFFKDENIRPIKLSKNYESMLGQPISELLGKNMNELFPSDLAKSMVADDMKILHEGKVISLEEEFNGHFYTTIKFPIHINGKPRYLAGYTIDVTDRKLSEKKLFESELRFRQMFDKAPLGYQSLDINGNFIDVNQEWLDTLGYSREEVIGKWFGDFLTPNYRNKFRERFPIFKAKGEIHNEFEMLHKNGNIRFIAFDGRVGTDLEGEFKQTHCILKDITAQKKAEDTLEKERNLLKTLIDNLPSGIFVKDKNYRKVVANKLHLESTASHLAHIGIDPQMDIIGKTDFEVFTKEEAQKYYLDDQKVINDGESIINKEEEGFGPDGKRIWLMISKIPLYDTRDNIIGMIGITTDITERKQILDTLAEEEFLLQSLMDNVPESIYFKDMESRFIRINKSLAKKHNLKSSQDAIGKTDFDFFTYEHANQAYNDEQEIIHTGQIIEKEEKETWVGKPDTWVATTKLPLYGKDGSIIGTFGISMDITDRKAMEIKLIQKSEEIATQNQEYYSLNEELLQINRELLAAKEKAEENDRLKTAFLNNMSHEIRTPMNAIMGFSALLTRFYNDKAKLELFASIIDQRCSDLLVIIDDILNIAKIESGQLSVNFEECNLNALFDELIVFFTQQQIKLNKQNISFNLQTQCDPSKVSIVTDKVKLKQIFINLIGNAFKFTDNGYIKGGCKIVDDTNILFYVSDTGIGISIEKQNVIFERFVQLEPTPGRLYGGTGLGLSIVSGLVELLNGKLWLESEPGKGTTFYFSIPYQPVNVVELKVMDKQEGKPLNNLQGKTVLIVEDDFFNAVFIKEILTDTGLHTITASNGSEAIQIALGQHIDIILMDIGLPDMSGYAVTSQIKQYKPDIKIIAQTAYASNEDRHKSIESGCVDFISKPLNSEKLISMINRYLTKD